LKRINKSEAHAELDRFKIDNANASWEFFRNYESGQPYEVVRRDLFIEQSWLCAYCEVEIPEDGNKHHRRIEHFHSKGDQPNVNYDITFDWNNLLGVCLGGIEKHNTEHYATPENLSCDAHKERMESKNGCAKDWNGNILSPLQIPEDILLFTFDKRTGKLGVNDNECNRLSLIQNNFSTTAELVDNTISVLNLNCRRLNDARLEILYERERIIKRARERRDRSYLTFFYNKWLTDSSLKFSTTKIKRKFI